MCAKCPAVSEAMTATATPTAATGGVPPSPPITRSVTAASAGAANGIAAACASISTSEIAARRGSLRQHAALYIRMPLRKVIGGPPRSARRPRGPGRCPPRPGRRRRPVRRPVAADRHRAVAVRPAGGRPGARPRRADGGAGRPGRGGVLRQVRRAHSGGDLAAHLAPVLLGAPGRPDRGDRRRAGGRAGQPRRADDDGRPLRPAVPPPGGAVRRRPGRGGQRPGPRGRRADRGGPPMTFLKGILMYSAACWRNDPRRAAISLVLMLAQAAAMPLAAPALAVVTDRVIGGDGRGAAVAAVGVAVAVIASLTAGHFAHIFYFELAEATTLEFERELIELSNGSAGLEHHERPDYAQAPGAADRGLPARLPGDRVRAQRPRTGAGDRHHRRAAGQARPVAAAAADRGRPAAAARPTRRGA